MRALSTLILATTLFAGCDYLKDLEEFTYEDTADTGADADADADADTDTDADADADTDTDTDADLGTARVRFINLAPEATAVTVVASDGTELASGALNQLEGTAYSEVPAGSIDLIVYDGDGNQLVRYDDALTLDDGGSLSLPIAETFLGVLGDDYSDIAADQTRINLLNVGEPSVEAWIMYSDDGGASWTVKENFSLDSGDSWNGDLDFGYLVNLELVFPGDEYDFFPTWNFSYFVQGDKGSVIDGYLWYEGDCSFGSDSCTPYLIGQEEDGTVFTVEGELAWTR